MPEYRLYFIDAKDTIIAREDFDTVDDGTAISASELVCQACSDVSGGFALWQDGRAVVEKRLSIDCRMSLDAASEAAQRIALAIQEKLQGDHWSIARSTKLLEVSQQLKLKLGRTSI